MPIIKPEPGIQNILTQAGLIEDYENHGPEKSVEERFNQVGLTNHAVASELRDIALNSHNESVKLRALDMVLKVKGALKDAGTIPSFNIIIQNSNSDLQQTRGMNPIFFPRQSLNTHRGIEDATTDDE